MIKITDFGMAKNLNNDNLNIPSYTESHVGTAYL